MAADDVGVTAGDVGVTAGDVGVTAGDVGGQAFALGPADEVAPPAGRPPHPGVPSLSCEVAEALRIARDAVGGLRLPAGARRVTPTPSRPVPAG
ncbi:MULTISPECIES: hypothetical protein [unclassified Streptomyces]|uniref:hypothetical protein n=1 Tax=unclassified Streptomyces TaxID=2593676 RepID=UPI0033AFB181